jgi:RimJ/RimL family protein N-acetyltransferase
MNLRPVELLDATFLYALLAERPPEANISHAAMPTFEEHVEFMKTEPYTAWYVIERGQPIGSIYLTDHDEIGIFLLKEHQGKGFGSHATRMLMSRHQRGRYLANVSVRNIASRSLFVSLDFKPVQITYELKLTYHST